MKNVMQGMKMKSYHAVLCAGGHHCNSNKVTIVGVNQRLGGAWVGVVIQV